MTKVAPIPKIRHKRKPGFRGPKDASGKPAVGARTRFQPGNKLGTGGRPSMKPYTDAYRKIADRTIKDLQIRSSDTVAVAVAKAMAQKAAQGKVPAAQEIANRIEGTPLQTINMDTGRSDPLAELIAEFRLQNEKKADAD